MPVRSRRCLSVEPLEGREVPATFVVTTFADVVDPADRKLSIREAVDAANINPGLDVIRLPAGVFRMSSGGADDTNAAGDYDVTDALTVRGAGAARTIIDAQGNDRLFDLFGPIAVQMTGVTLRHGGGDLAGGAVRAADADLTLVSCVVSDNHARDGGGIDAGTGRVTLVNTTVCRNVADQHGGGIRVGTGALALTGSTVRRNQAGFQGGGILAGSVTLTRCTVSDNTTALSGGPFDSGVGGGLFADAAELVDCVVAGNSAGAGGGVEANTITATRCTISGNVTSLGGGGLAGGSVVVTDSTISGNSAGFGFSAGDGGGISAGTAAVTNSTISGNTARFGGGIDATTANLTNCTIAGNTGRFGGGVHAFDGALVNCTIAENFAHSGGGLSVATGLTLRNTIVALNHVDFAGADPELSGAVTSLGHNLIGDGTGATAFVDGTNGDRVGTSDVLLDPLLGPLRNNGGRTQTMALLAGSPAIDHGDPVSAPAVDQRGRARGRDGNGDRVAAIDIGAVER